MQDEVNEKTVSLCIRCGKVTANLLKAAMKKALTKMEQEKQKLQGQKQPKQDKEDKTYKGKQSSVFFIILLNPDLIINFLHTIIKRFSTLFIYGFDDGSLGQRVGTLMNWPKYFHKNNIQGLFGSGFNTIDNVFLNEYSYFRGYMTADCQYVSLLIETGVLGLFIFLYSFVKVYFKSSKLTSSGIFLKLLLVSYAIQCITYDITTYFIFIPFLWGVVLYGTEKKQKGCNSNFIL